MTANKLSPEAQQAMAEYVATYDENVQERTIESAEEAAFKAASVLLMLMKNDPGVSTSMLEFSELVRKHLGEMKERRNYPDITEYVVEHETYHPRRSRFNGNASASVPAADPPVDYDDTSGIDRRRCYIPQPNDYSCAPTALAEACFDFGAPGGELGRKLGIKFDGATYADPIKRMAVRQAVEAAVKEPQEEFQSINEMAEFARKFGLSTNLHFDPDSGGAITPQNVDEAMKVLDAVLRRGHIVIINVPHHFVLCIGLTPDGQYIMCDPADPSTSLWSRWRMANEMDHEYDPYNDNSPSTPTGFVEVWNPKKPVHDHLVSIASPQQVTNVTWEGIPMGQHRSRWASLKRKVASWATSFLRKCSKR